MKFIWTVADIDTVVKAWEDYKLESGEEVDIITYIRRDEIR